MSKIEHTEDAGLSLREVIEKYYAAIRADALYVTRSEEEAEDITQEVFTSLAERWDELKHERIGAWIFGALRFRLLEYFRENGRQNKTVPIDGPAAINSSSISSEDNYFALSDEQIEKIRQKVLSVLSEKERKLYEIYFVEGRTYDDICALYSISYSAATSRIKRIRRKLEKSIKKNSPDTLSALAASPVILAYVMNVIFNGK